MSIFDKAMILGGVNEAISVMTQHYLREQPHTDIYKEIIAEVDRAVITTTLAETEGNQTKASEVLAMNRGTFRAKRESLRIDRRGISK